MFSYGLDAPLQISYSILVRFNLTAAVQMRLIVVLIAENRFVEKLSS